MADVGAVNSLGSSTSNVQNQQDTKSTGELFNLLLSSMLNESSGSIGDFSNLDGSDSGDSLPGGSSGLMGSSSMMDTLLFMMLLAKQGNGNGINSDMLMELMGMGSSSSAISAMSTPDSSLFSAMDSSGLGGSNSGIGSALSGTPASLLTSYLNQYQNASSLSAIPSTSWLQVNPTVVSHVGERNASTYRNVINQFNVETNPRYTVNKLGENDTYCNIFAWDVSRAMGAEIPHYVNTSTGEPVQAGGANATELDANGMNDWLNTYGKQYGWVPATAQQAQDYANQGMPAVTSWKNPSGHGHMQVVSPSTDGKYDPTRGVAIAQAGEHLYNYNYITAVYGPDSLKNVQYFVHI